LDIPTKLKYTKEHEWVKVEDNIVTVGITDYAQGELGDIVFVEMPRLNSEVKTEQPFGTIEAVKAVSDMFAPVSGKVIAINEILEDDPMIINRDPYGEGWMIKIELSDPAQIDKLLSADDYRQIVG
jgi:glycine cleavage system H protein